MGKPTKGMMMDIMLVAAYAAVGTPILSVAGWLLERFVLRASQRSRISVSVGAVLGLVLAALSGSLVFGLAAIPGIALWVATDIPSEETRTVAQFGRDVVQHICDGFRL